MNLLMTSHKQFMEILGVTLTKHSLGATQIGLDNYHKIIDENGNPRDVVIGIVGYGINYRNEFFAYRVSDQSYNFMLENQNIAETIPQGSRIAEVLVDSTTPNVKIMPLVTVTKEGYTSICSIARAISFGIKNSNVICYELINKENEVINKMLESAFRENVPVCCVASSEKDNYPSTHGMTIATSSVDRDMNFSDYSGQGDFIDFTAPSTDIEEIFNPNSTVSRWSGPGYSNALIVSSIALIKTYNIDATILDVYNFLRNFCIDLGDEGKDILYGYGCPNFKEIKISDIDKEAPQFKQIEYENENWEVIKQVKIVAEDNIRIKAWAINQTENEVKEEEWKVLEEVTPKLDTTYDITENGKYYIWLQDTAGNTTRESIQIDKIDNKLPQIAYTIDTNTLSQGYVTINVTAEDSEVGMYDSPFSWDKITWSQENGSRRVTENGRYKVYAEDNLGNIGELEILVNCFPEEGIAEIQEGDIITNIEVPANWTGNTNNAVKITLNKDIDIAGWQITTAAYAPYDFVQVEQNTPQNNNNENNNNNDSNNSENNDPSINAVLPNNVVIDNIVRRTENNQPNIEPIANFVPRTEPIVITTSLDVNVNYYLWIKDSNGNTRYQNFKIMKKNI